MRLIHRYLLLLPFLCLAAAAPAQDNRQAAQADLQAVVKQVESLQKDLERQRRDESKARQALAEIETAEQAARSKLSKVRQQQTELTAKRATLTRQAEEQERNLADQRAQLAEQLHAAYINGREEWLRMSLSQQDPTQLGRQQAYYGYLSQARAQLVADVTETLAQLEATRIEMDAAATELDVLAAAAQTQLADVAAARKKRAKIVTALASEISSKDAEIKTLQAQEKKLRDLVVALDKMMREAPALNAEPFAGKTASLAWPVDGSLLHRFGQPRADGRLKWQGVLISAANGSTVRAVYDGRVVFADWLDGMGLLLIIEHGGGYMSLYGHNQTLLRDVGQTVRAGDVIAEVGDSGGQAKPGLYFEIRKNGTAVNPQNWIK